MVLGHLGWLVVKGMVVAAKVYAAWGHWKALVVDWSHQLLLSWSASLPPCGHSLRFDQGAVRRLNSPFQKSAWLS